MDSLPVHKSKYVKPHFEELNIRPLYAPIYSPEYNPIEMMFSKLKRRVKNMRLKDMVQSKKKFTLLIPLAAKDLSVEDCSNYI